MSKQNESKIEDELRKQGLDTDQQLEMTDKFQKLLDDPEERRLFLQKIKEKDPDSYAKIVQLGVEMATKGKPMN